MRWSRTEEQEPQVQRGWQRPQEGWSSLQPPQCRLSESPLQSTVWFLQPELWRVAQDRAG